MKRMTGGEDWICLEGAETTGIRSLIGPDGPLCLFVADVLNMEMRSASRSRHGWRM